MPVLQWLDVTLVKNLIENEGMTISALSEHLEESFPDHEGLSIRNLKRFMAEHNIHGRQFVPDVNLDEAVASASGQVGGAYGRKMMKGLLESKGVVASEHRIQNSLQRVSPYYHQNRAQGIQNQVNPQRYHAPYFGYNLHMDQNEKLVDYGVVFVIAVDGKSGFIPGAAVMPRKNNVTIYKEVFVPAVNAYGLWDCVICDHGKEFFLVEFIQHYLSNQRIRSNGVLSQREPYKQVQSTKNNRVERLWGEVNNRVGYPLKWALKQLEEQQPQNFNPANPTHLFASSQITMVLAKEGIQQFIDAWNAHPVPHTGSPMSYISSRQNYQLQQNILPSADDAIQLYSNSGGHLTDEGIIGTDLLYNLPQVSAERDNRIWQEVNEHYGSANGLFGLVANHNYTQFHDVIIRFISLTADLYNNQ